MPALALLALALAASAPVDVRPHALKLSEGGALQVTVDLPGDGPLVLVPSEGKVSAKADGVFEVAPGPGRSPRLLLLAAFRDAPGAVPVFVSVPIWGRARIPVQSDPRADVTAEIAGQRFGPFRADARGRAFLTVEVPPGHETGTTRAVAPGGTPVTRNLPLDPPAYRKLHAVVVQDEPAPDGTLRARVVVGSADEPPPVARIKVVADRGRVGPVKVLTDGRFVADLELPRAKAGSFQVWVGLSGDRTSVFVVPTKLEPPVPAALRVDAPAEVVGGSSVALSVAVVDGRGHGIAGPTPRLWAGGAEITLSPGAPGVFSGQVVASPQAGNFDLDASLDAPALVASRSIQIVPDRPASLHLGAAALHVAADGKAELEVPAVVVGISGKLLSTVPTVTASLGRAEVVSRPDGALLRYVPPRIERPAPSGSAELVARVGELSARTVVTLDAVAPAARSRSYLRIEGGAGGVSALAPGPEIALAAGVPVLRVERSALIVEAAAAFRTASGSDLSGNETGLSALVGLRGPAGPLQVEVAAGPGALLVSASGSAGRFSSTLPALFGRLTLGVPLGPGALTASLALQERLSKGNLGPDADQLPGGLSFRGGYRLDIGP